MGHSTKPYSYGPSQTWAATDCKGGEKAPTNKPMDYSYNPKNPKMEGKNLPQEYYGEKDYK